MFKHLYKTLLIAVISGSLLTIHSPVAFAQTNSNQSTTQTKTTPNANDNTVTDKDGIISSTQVHNFDQVKESDMLASITMLAGGFIGARMIKSYKPVTMDVMIAGAGGVAFIAGEVLGAMKFKGKFEEMTAEVTKRSDGKINDEQIKKLQELKASYEEAKKGVKTKKTLQLAAAAAFGAAAATATYMAITEKTKDTACSLALQSAKTALTGCSTAGATSPLFPYAVQCGTCLTQVGTLEATYLSYTAKRDVPNKSAATAASVKPAETYLTLPANYCPGIEASPVGPSVKAVQTACTAATVEKVKNETTDPVPEDEGTIMYTDNLNKDVETFITQLIPSSEINAQVEAEKALYSASVFAKIVNLFFPEANAGWLPLLGLGAGAIAAFTLISGTTAKSIDTFMFTPTNRAIAFGLLAALSFMASKASDNVMKQLDEYIRRIQLILDDLDKLGKGVGSPVVANQAQQLQTVNPKLNTRVATPKTAMTAKTPCMTSNCKSASGQLANLPGFNNLPDTFKDMATDSVRLGDSLSGKGLTGGSLAGAEGVGSKQAAMDRLLKKQQANLKKLTKGKVDLAKGQDKLLKSLAASIRRDLKSQGSSPSGFLSSVGSYPLDSSSVASDKEAELDKILPDPVGVDNLGAPEKIGKDDMDLDFKEEAVAGAGDAAGASSGAEYDVEAGDISGENGPSLFEVISRRYLKSGYPKLLEEEPVKK